jgi:hypothetical protein
MLTIRTQATCGRVDDINALLVHAAMFPSPDIGFLPSLPLLIASSLDATIAGLFQMPVSLFTSEGCFFASASGRISGGKDSNHDTGSSFRVDRSGFGILRKACQGFSSIDEFLRES